MLLKGIFDASVSVAESTLSEDTATLYPEERLAMVGAFKRRLREFTAGRSCAREAMRQLGLPEMAIPIGPDRAPIWPLGITGSISHSSTRCAAAVARHSDGIKAVGLDVEEETPLDDFFAEEICTSRERDWLDQQPSSKRGKLLKAIFSAKECTYKCQYQLTRRMFGFEAVHIELSLAEEAFAAYFDHEVPPFRLADRLRGSIRFHEGHVVTGMIGR